MTPAARRLAIVLLALVAAYAAAALLITVCMFFEWEEILRASGTHAARLALGVLALIASAKMLLATLLAVALAERYRIRSVELYAAVTGLGFAILASDLGIAAQAASGVTFLGREREILVGAGIAAGFVYWALAGRTAGAWQDVAERPHG
jgi:hypothetical protein